MPWRLRWSQCASATQWWRNRNNPKISSEAGSAAAAASATVAAAAAPEAPDEAGRNKQRTTTAHSLRSSGKSSNADICPWRWSHAHIALSSCARNARASVKLTREACWRTKSRCNTNASCKRPHSNRALNAASLCSTDASNGCARRMYCNACCAHAKFSPSPRSAAVTTAPRSPWTKHRWRVANRKQNGRDAKSAAGGRRGAG